MFWIWKLVYAWTICHVKPKFSWWTKLLDNLFLAKYLVSVAAILNDLLNFREMKQKLSQSDENV